VGADLESELGGARELVDEFEARLQALSENQNEPGEADAIGETKPKRRRERPPNKKVKLVVADCNEDRWLKAKWLHDDTTLGYVLKSFVEEF
jgi:hypothetical protein